MTAELPTFNEAFAYSQAYAIENGIGLTKKRTNYREKAVLSATRTCAATPDPTRRIVSHTCRSRKIGRSRLMMPSAQAFSSSAPARLTPTLPSLALINTNYVVPASAFDLGLNPSTRSPGFPDVVFVCGKLAPYDPSDEPFSTGAFSAYATISTMTGNRICGFRAIPKGVYGGGSICEAVAWGMAKQRLFSTPLMYPAEASRTQSSHLLAISGPKEGTMCDSSH